MRTTARRSSTRRLGESKPSQYPVGQGLATVTSGFYVSCGYPSRPIQECDSSYRRRRSGIAWRDRIPSTRWTTDVHSRKPCPSRVIAGLLNPAGELSFVELVVLMDVEQRTFFCFGPRHRVVRVMHASTTSPFPACSRHWSSGPVTRLSASTSVASGSRACLAVPVAGSSDYGPDGVPGRVARERTVLRSRPAASGICSAPCREQRPRRRANRLRRRRG